MHPVDTDELHGLVHHLGHFEVLANGDHREAHALLRAASRPFRRALHTHAKIIASSGVHRSKAHDATPEEADMIDRMATNPDPEGNDELHHEYTELHGQGIRKFFRRAFHAVKNIAHKVVEVVGTPFELAVQASRAAKTVGRDAARGDFSTAKDALSVTGQAIDQAGKVAAIYNGVPAPK